MRTPEIDVDTNLHEYFVRNRLSVVVEQLGELAPGEAADADFPYQPKLADLYRLHRFIIEFRRTTVLEFGVGWSTLVMADALRKNFYDYNHQVSKLRRANPFELFAVDGSEDFIEVARNRLSKELREHVTFSHSPVHMSEFNGRICTRYDNLPLVNPDFIYVDAPFQYEPFGEVRGWSTHHRDIMPMMSDLLHIEHFLLPGTIIVFDGRTANARFVSSNFQRNWTAFHESEYDQTVMLLDEEPLGGHNEKQLEFYKYGKARLP
jgi:hypothetical protein